MFNYLIPQFVSLSLKINQRSFASKPVTTSPIKESNKLSKSILYRYTDFITGMLFMLVLIILYFEIFSDPIIDSVSLREPIFDAVQIQSNPSKGTDISLRNSYLKPGLSDSTPSMILPLGIILFVGVASFMGGMYLYGFFAPSLIDFSQEVVIGSAGIPDHTPSLITGKAISFALPPMSPEVKVDGEFPSQTNNLLNTYFLPTDET